MTMNGFIVKGVGGFYTVHTTDENEYVCRARGRFRKTGITPLPGDRVNITVAENSENSIDEILPRKNYMIRPAVANLDKLFIVISASSPEPDFMLSDKLLLQCELSHVSPLIIVNKCDERDADKPLAIMAQYKPAGYEMISASAHTKEGIEEITAQINGCLCCFAGQSAVGKSSLMNAIMPGLNLEVGDISKKTERGKHTTRHAELWLTHGGAVVDTPGFSLLEPAGIEPQELSLLYPEMRKYAGQCRFPECLHISEPDCAIKPLLLNGELSIQRYERYKAIIEELKEMRKHKYD